MRKANRKLLIVLVALLLTLITVSTATFAWFSMNTTVSGSNMNIQASAPTNMMISNDLENWANGVLTNTNISGGFAPSSTTDGKTFFALASTKGIDVNGSIVDNSNIGTVDLAQVDRFDGENTFYVEFPLYIKATEDTSKPNDLELYLETLNVTTTTNNLQKVTRVSITSVTPAGGAVASANTGLITVNNDGTIKTGETPLTESSAIVYKFDTETAVKPVESVTAGTPTLSDSDSAITTATEPHPTCFVVDKDGVYYTTIIVRIWLEGQHPNCINAAAGETVNISLGWRVKDQVQP